MKLLSEVLRVCQNRIFACVWQNAVSELLIVAWLLTPAPSFASCLQEWEQNRPSELANMLGNFLIVHRLLNNGMTAPAIGTISGLVYVERNGIFAVDERGCQKNGKREKFQSGRLYFFPDEATRVVHMISIGEKKTRKQDVQAAGGYTVGLQKQREGQTGSAS